VLLSLVIKGFFFANFIKKTSKIVQEQLIDILLTSPLSWFDVTPTGRILTRTTRDQDDLDTNLSFNIQSSIQNLLVLLSSIILVSIASPFYLIVVGVSGLVYFRVVLIYLRSSREIKRLLSNSRALLNTHFQETCSGVTLIRTHHQEEVFRSYFLRYQKMVIMTISNQNITNRWIKLITDLFSVILIGSAGYLSVFVVAANP
jgi:ABC-type multidrug transport system fused ATPase/permease subunit